MSYCKCKDFRISVGNYGKLKAKCLQTFSKIIEITIFLTFYFNFRKLVKNFKYFKDISIESRESFFFYNYLAYRNVFILSITAVCDGEFFKKIIF